MKKNSTNPQFSGAREPSIRIGRFTFDREAGDLRLNGRGTRLAPKTAELLALLVNRNGRILSRDEIVRAIWPHGFVHENNLTQHVYVLRKALEADPFVHIENLPKRGYRLRIAPAHRRSAGHVPIAAALALLLLPFANGTPALPEAARAEYALAMYHLDRPAQHATAQQDFQRTVRLAPGLPQGYAGLALLDAMSAAQRVNRMRSCARGWTSAYAASRRGDIAMVHVARAMLFFICDRSRAAARREIAAALRSDPNDALTLNFAARLAMWTGSGGDAIAYAQRAVLADPASPEVRSTLGLAEYYAGDFEASAATLASVLELMPNDPVIRRFIKQARAASRHAPVRNGNFTTTLRDLRRLQSQNPLAAQIAWRYDYRLQPLRSRYPALASQFETY